MSRKAFFMTLQAPDQLRLEHTFQDLAYMDQKKVLISAFRKATRPTVDAAKANIPHDRTGNLRKSIGMLVMNNEIAVVVGARRKGGFKGYHGHIVEEGTVERSYVSKRGVKHRTGKMNPNGAYAHFLKKAVDSTEAGVLNTVAGEWYYQVEKIHRKNGMK